VQPIPRRLDERSDAGPSSERRRLETPGFITGVGRADLARNLTWRSFEYPRRGTENITGTK
jgi:hypothetical protein